MSKAKPKPDPLLARTRYAAPTKVERVIPVRAPLFWPCHLWSGPGLQQGAIKSEPSPNKFHYLLHHFPARRQIRIVEIHPGKRRKEAWMPDSYPRSIEYVEPTYEPPPKDE